jgi:mRNA-degrading endonuclease RelE of RelBE toxin-antitoxin system
LWNDRLRIAGPVEAEWSTLAADDRSAVRVALERIDDDPLAGAPLYAPLRGLWSYRVGPFRIVYRIVADARLIVVLLIQKVEATAA